ncbi:MAG: glycosyltransferase family 8 protein [Akkermansia sp.]
MNAKKHIALAADGAFSVPLALSLYSLQCAVAHCEDYCIHLLDGGIERALLSSLKLDIRYYDVSSALKHLPASGRFPNSIYYRYLLPDIIPQDIRRIFYMDVDTMVCSDISALWDVDMGDCIMAACPWLVFAKAGQEYKPFVDHFTQRMGIAEDDEPYFYSSMLMMDLERMRQEQITRQLVETTELYPPSQLLWPDQDVLNVVLRGRIASLPLSYNVIPIFAQDIDLESSAARQAYHHPHIVHFAATKPNILTGAKYPFEDQFFALWKNSPWCYQIPYPLVSTYGMGACTKAILLTPIKLGISCPLFLRAYGRLLGLLRSLLSS